MPFRHLPGFSTALTRRLLPVMIVAMLALGLVTGIMLWHNFNSRNTAIARNAATSAAANLEETIALFQSQLEMVATLLVTPDSNSLPTYDWHSTRGFAAIMLVDAKDNIRDARVAAGTQEQRGSLLGINLARIPEYAQCRANFRPCFVGNLLDGRRLLLMIKPLQDGSLLLLLVDPKNLPLLAPTDGFVILLDNAGRPADGSGQMSQAAMLEIGRTIQTPPIGGTTTINMGGIAYRASRVAVTGTSWSLLACNSLSGQHLAFSRELGFFFAFMITFIGIAGLVLVLVIHQTIRPVRELARHLETNDPTPSQHYFELEKIAHRVRHFASRLQKREIKLRRMDEILAYMAKGPSANPMTDFFQALAGELAATTGVRCVLIAEWVMDATPRARILASRSITMLPKDFTYELRGNPCQQLNSKPLIYIREDVSRQYPESPLLRMLGAEGYMAVPLVLGEGLIGGHIELIDDHQLKPEAELRDLLLAVAIRSAAELERIRTRTNTAIFNQFQHDLHLDSLEMVCRWMPDGTMTYVNSGLLNTFQIDRDQLIGKPIISLIHGEDRNRFWSHLDGLRDGPQASDLRLKLPDGSFRWVRWTGRAIQDEKGRIIEYQGTGLDITRLRTLEMTSGEMRQTLEMLQSDIPLAVWISDWTTHRCLWATTAMEMIWNRTKQELQETPMAWTMAIHEEDRPRVVRNYLLHAAEGHYREEYRVVQPTGKIRLVRDKAVPFSSPDGTTKRIANIAMDITDANVSPVP